MIRSTVLTVIFGWVDESGATFFPRVHTHTHQANSWGFQWKWTKYWYWLVDIKSFHFYGVAYISNRFAGCCPSINSSVSVSALIQSLEWTKKKPKCWAFFDDVSSTLKTSRIEKKTTNHTYTPEESNPPIIPHGLEDHFPFKMGDL